MKDLKEIFNENVNDARSYVFSEIQGDTSKGAAYSTIDTSEGASKYKYGFLTYNQFQEYVGLVAFNKVEDLQDLLDTDDDEYSSLLNMKPQEHKVIRNIIYINTSLPGSLPLPA